VAQGLGREDSQLNETEVCKHHWIIPSPDGTVSQGCCKKCGAEREFYNWQDEGFKAKQTRIAASKTQREIELRNKGLGKEKVPAQEILAR
jgi:hypothetical protein